MVVPDSGSARTRHIRMSFFARVIFLAILAEIVLGQPSPPAQGIQLWLVDRSLGVDARFPLTVTQCEPVFIYYNNTYSIAASDTFGGVALNPAFHLPYFLIFYFPPGVGYIEWICNIPAGYSFWVRANLNYPIVVQPGSSSFCLRDITTTYRHATYSTAYFQSYTAGPPTSLAPLSFYLATYARFHPCCLPDTESRPSGQLSHSQPGPSQRSL
jgi:hypothetical protein